VEKEQEIISKVNSFRNQYLVYTDLYIPNFFFPHKKKLIKISMKIKVRKDLLAVLSHTGGEGEPCLLVLFLLFFILSCNKMYFYVLNGIK